MLGCVWHDITMPLRYRTNLYSCSIRYHLHHHIDLPATIYNRVCVAGEPRAANTRTRFFLQRLGKEDDQRIAK